MKKIILSMLAVALLITVNIQAQETSKKVLVEKAITQNSKEISERDKEVDKKIKYMQKKASWGTGNVVAIKTIFQKLNDTIKNNKTNPKIKNFIIYSNDYSLLFNLCNDTYPLEKKIKAQRISILNKINDTLLTKNFLNRKEVKGRETLCFEGQLSENEKRLCITYVITNYRTITLYSEKSKYKGELPSYNQEFWYTFNFYNETKPTQPF
mgnify:FL=1